MQEDIFTDCQDLEMFKEGFGMPARFRKIKIAPIGFRAQLQISTIGLHQKITGLSLKQAKQYPQTG